MYPTSEPDLRDVPSEFMAIREAAWRGARYGAKVSAMILTGGLLAGFLLIGGVFAYHWVWLDRHIEIRLTFGEALLRLGTTIGAIAVTAIYGGVTGALVMAIGAATGRLRRPKT